MVGEHGRAEGMTTPWYEPPEDDHAYWAHAQAAVSEGICPDCRQALSLSDPKCNVETAATMQFPQCRSCGTEWVRWVGSDRWTRFEITEFTLRRLG